MEISPQLRDFLRWIENNSGKRSESSESMAWHTLNELDRCKPDYAMELLERVKHLYNVSGMIFILVLYKDHY